MRRQRPMCFTETSYCMIAIHFHSRHNCQIFRLNDSREFAAIRTIRTVHPINYLKGTNWYRGHRILWLRGNILLRPAISLQQLGKMSRRWHGAWPSNRVTGLHSATHSDFTPPSCFIACITWLIISRRLLMSAAVDTCHLLGHFWGDSRRAHTNLSSTLKYNRKLYFTDYWCIVCIKIYIFK